MYDPNITKGLVIAPVKKKDWLDPSTKVMSIETYLETAPLDDTIKKIVEAVVKHVAAAGPFLPWIQIVGKDVLLTWNNDNTTQPRLLYILIPPDHLPKYQVSVHPVVNGDFDWKFITEGNRVSMTLKYLGHYICGTLEVSTTKEL